MPTRLSSYCFRGICANFSKLSALVIHVMYICLVHANFSKLSALVVHVMYTCLVHFPLMYFTTFFKFGCLMDGSYHALSYFGSVLSIFEPNNYSGFLDLRWLVGQFLFRGHFCAISAIYLLQLSISFLSRLDVAFMHAFSCMCTIFWSNSNWYRHNAQLNFYSLHSKL